MSATPEQYRGKPYERGAVGPDAYGCGGLVVVALAEVWGRALPVPELAIISEREPLRFVRLATRLRKDDRMRLAERPHDGDLVAMGRDGAVLHVGIVVDREGCRGILHASESAGRVVIEPVLRILQSWREVAFYRAESWAR